MAKPSVIKRTRGDKVFDTVNLIIMTLLLIVSIYPLYFVLIASFSDPFEVVRGNVFLYPKGFLLEAYGNVFKESRIWTGYRNTVFYTVVGTFFSLCLTITCAFGLSRKTLPGRSLLGIYFLIPMYFGGGLIPTYMVIKNLNLINKWYTLVILGSASIYNMIVTRVYLQSNIPEELYESAHIDGASDFRTFFSIVLPLIKPIIAVMTLFYAVARWNDYFTALVYVSKNDYLPLQMILRSILLNNAAALENLDTSSMDAEAVKQAARLSYMAEAMKYALIIVSSAPLLVAYPFVQKYFVKGMLIGAIKG